MERIDVKKRQYITLGNELDHYAVMKKRAFDAEHKKPLTGKLNSYGKQIYECLDSIYNRIIWEIIEDDKE